MSSNESKTYYQYGKENLSKLSSADSKEPKKETLKEPVTYTYLPLQDLPKQPEPEKAKGPLYSYTYVPPHVMQQYSVLPVVMGPCYASLMAYAPISLVDQAQPVLTPYVPVYHWASLPASPPPPVAVPNGTVPWMGATKAEVDAQNAKIAEEVGATKPIKLIPYQAAPGQQFWVKELDGGFTLHTTDDIMESCQPGRWTYASAGYPYFVREKPAETAAAASTTTAPAF